MNVDTTQRIASPPPPPPAPRIAPDSLGTAVADPVRAALDQFRQAQDPVSQGAALRTLDTLLGRSGTQATLTGQGTSAVSMTSGPDPVDEGRNVGRGSVRPHLGDGPATPSQVSPGGKIGAHV